MDLAASVIVHYIVCSSGMSRTSTLALFTLWTTALIALTSKVDLQLFELLEAADKGRCIGVPVNSMPVWHTRKNMQS